MREYRALNALRSGKCLNLNGILLIKVDEEIVAGDLFVGERGQGPQLLTAESINTRGSWINPTATDHSPSADHSIQFSYNSQECVKVRDASDRGTDGFFLNGFVDPYPHDDAEHPCFRQCCTADVGEVLIWTCESDNTCFAKLHHPGVCINCEPPPIFIPE